MMKRIRLLAVVLGFLAAALAMGGMACLQAVLPNV
jgi:hypothetical protein